MEILSFLTFSSLITCTLSNWKQISGNIGKKKVFVTYKVLMGRQPSLKSSSQEMSKVVRLVVHCYEDNSMNSISYYIELKNMSFEIPSGLIICIRHWYKNNFFLYT